MTAAMSNVACVFLLFASYCVIGLGGSVSDGSISASLVGHVNPVFLSVSNTVLALAVLVTYPLQFYPAIQILDYGLHSRGFPRNSKVFIVTRLIISFLCGVIALIVPDISSLVSLIGSLGNPMLGLIMPSAIYFSQYSKKRVWLSILSASSL